MHKRHFPFDLAKHSNVSIVEGDLDKPDSLLPATKDIDCVIHLAGVLFRPRPETFLHRTNTVYVRNIVDAALTNGVRKFILVSFPHVEGQTTPDARATGRLDAHPTSIHARTRLEAEKYLFTACEGKGMKALVLRAGVIYGRDVKLIEAAHQLAKFGLLAVWRKPTWVHLLALLDFLSIFKGGFCNLVLHSSRSDQQYPSLKKRGQGRFAWVECSQFRIVIPSEREGSETDFSPRSI
jgi:nucleoside-diphosphate-sugar epimerase